MKSKLFYTITLLFLSAIAIFAQLQGRAGEIQIELLTDPPTVKLGRSNLILTLRNADGRPVTGAQVSTFTAMPNMNMGERVERATERRDQPGVYESRAAFPMEGGYEVRVTVNAGGQEQVAVIPVSTGQTVGPTGGGFPWLWVVGGIALVAIAAFTVHRMRATGQAVNFRALGSRAAILGVAMLVGITALAVYAVNNWRRQGAMTPIEAQAMEMNTPAPAGVAVVELASAQRGSVRATVRYSGQAVAFNEQDVIPRVTGSIVWMPGYVGDRVRAGQVVARLDTSQIEPQVAERRAMANMARRAAGTAEAEYRMALAELNEKRAEANAKRRGLEEAASMIEAARQERAGMQADLEAMQTEVTAMEADLAAMKADQAYQTEALARSQKLLTAGAVTREEYQRDKAMADTADAKVRQAQANVNRARAKVNAARTAVRRSEAMVQSAIKRQSAMQGEVQAAEAAVRSQQAAAEAARSRIGEAQSGIEQAQAGLAGAETSRGYTEIRSLTDGVITQRLVSPGTLVNPGQPVLRIAQVNPIRLQANVPRTDLGRIRVGSTATVRGKDGRPFAARVSSVQPAVDPAARTGIAEVVYENRDNRFLPGEFVEMEFAVGEATDSLVVPATAVSRRAEGGTDLNARETQAWVWVAEPQGDGTYKVRRTEVETGPSDGRRVAIRSGLNEGQRVVAVGYATLRDGDTVSTGETQNANLQTAEVNVTDAGYEPTSIRLRAGVPAKVTFTRKTEGTCGEEIVIPEFGIRKTLPLNQPVTLEFTPSKTGSYQFNCGMDMLKGTVVVQ